MAGDMPRPLAFASLAAMLLKIAALAGIMAVAGCAGEADRTGVVVLAASSLQESLDAVADDWAAEGHARPVLSFAASPALARQLQSGAPADLFLSADEAWMDAVAGDGLLRDGSRGVLLGNRMVLIAPRGGTARIDLADPSAFTAALGGGRLSMADPGAVPAGRYAKAALESLGLWRGVADRLARGENVRAALALVERGEAPLGIVYATDAIASERVRVVARFPTSSHPPIRYAVAVLAASNHADADAFRDFLGSDRARTIFARFGFTAPQ